MELIIAFAVLAAGAVIALRSAVGTEPEEESAAPEPNALPKPEAAPPIEAEPEAAPKPFVTPVALLPASVTSAHPNGDGLGTSDTADTMTAPPVPGVPQPPAPPTAPATSGAATAVAPAKRHVHFLITEDLRLDEVLAAAEESAPPPARPALKLLFAVAGLAFAFASALLLVARGLQVLWSRLFG